MEDMPAADANDQGKATMGAEVEVQPKQAETTDESQSSLQQAPEVRPSKKAKERQEKKYKKKIAQAQATLLRSEGKKYAELINLNDRPSPCLLITHFGNGDEVDQNVLVDFCKRKGGPLKSLTIFPGINYGHVEFQRVEDAQRLMKVAAPEDGEQQYTGSNADDVQPSSEEGGMITANCALIDFPGSDNVNRIVVFFYTNFKCHQLKKSENVEIPPAEIASTGSIPGLFVIDDFLSAEEEANMLKDIDKNKWIKLLNRRV